MWSTTEYDMYSDSSSTTGSESEENFPGYIPVPMADTEGGTYGPPLLRGGEPVTNRSKVYQPYKGQLKISAYVNYGLLTVHVVSGRHLQSKTKETCDSYVKVSLAPDDLQRTKCKTEAVHDTNNPLYDEKFSFELLEEDSHKRLFITMWDRDQHRNQCEFLGCMSFGVKHIQSKQKTIHGWYYLLNADLGRKKHLQVTDRKHLAGRGITPVNQDVLWMEPRVLSIRRGKHGCGFTINGSCPVKVCRVDPKSTAEAAGVKVGDCIVRIDGLNVSRSTCDSVARIIKHAQKKILLEVQRPKKVDAGTFELESLERSPRQPLSSSTPFNVNRNHDNHSDGKEMPWLPGASRRTLTTVMEESSPNKYEETQNYGWIDHGKNHYEGEEDIYVEPDDIRPEVLKIPQDPPALPPNHPTMHRKRSALKKPTGGMTRSNSLGPGRQLEGMDVSPWKPPQQQSQRPSSRMENDYMPLDGVRQSSLQQSFYEETDLDDGSESRFEWDYSDTRLNRHQDDSFNSSDDENTLDNYGWIDSRWGPTPNKRQDRHKEPIYGTKHQVISAQERHKEPIYGTKHHVISSQDRRSHRNAPDGHERLQPAVEEPLLRRYGSSTGGSSSGYSTLPRSMKISTSQRQCRPVSYTDLPDRYQDNGSHGYRDDMAIRSTGAGAHGYQGDFCGSGAPRYVHEDDRRSYRSNSSGSLTTSSRGQYLTGSSSGSLSGSHSSSTLPRRKKVSFKDFN